jgi:hypothetical protein
MQPVGGLIIVLRQFRRNHNGSLVEKLKTWRTRVFSLVGISVRPLLHGYFNWQVS